jgi:pyruvate/2-oxoglutarate dehydrogenase complex dihydrolipoamide dehydrogenase (E3) component
MTRALVLPDDDANRELCAAVHPQEWKNPTAAGKYNLVVLGAGTAGLVTAAGAAGLGARVALIERHLMGGDCLNVGCVPSKAVIAAARLAAEARRAVDLGVHTGAVEAQFAAVMERMRRARARIAPLDGAPRFRDELGVDVFFGAAHFIDRSTVEVEGARLPFARAVIATGARESVPPIEGLEAAGYLTNETVFELTERPARLLVIGAGPIGCELAQSFARFGSAVTLLDAAPRILGKDDADAAAVVASALERDGVKVCCPVEVLRVEPDRTVIARYRGEEHRFAGDQILVAVGRKANVEELELARAGVETDSAGVVVDDHLRTGNRRIFAAGDCCSPWKFTHAADAMARIAIRNALFFGRARLSSLIIPWCTFTEPELAHVGLTPEEARQAGVELDTYERSFEHVDRAITDGRTGGFLRVHTRRGSDRIAGATIVAAHAGELIGELVLAMTAGVGLGAIANTIHPYPTLALALKQVGDQYSRTRLTARVAAFFRWLLAWRRR